MLVVILADKNEPVDVFSAHNAWTNSTSAAGSPVVGVLARLVAEPAPLPGHPRQTAAGRGGGVRSGRHVLARPVAAPARLPGHPRQTAARRSGGVRSGRHACLQPRTPSPCKAGEGEPGCLSLDFVFFF